MSLNPLYLIAPSLQEYFVDKDTGAPLAAGIVTFYKDQARTTLKTVYRLSGSPPNYTYTALQNPVTLSSVGTFQDPDTGDDILPYYYPYDSNGNVELYYITVYSADNVFQFSREGWPNISDGSNTDTNVLNYVPNGQFLIHTNLPAQPAVGVTPAYVAGEIRAPSTTLTQGGWTFDRPSGSTATDIVTFPAFGSAVTNPSASPQYSIRIITQIPGSGDTFKDLRLKFQDVNKFASATQEYTFGFSGKSNSGSVNVSLILIKNFGSGGSATSELAIANLTIPSGSFSIVQSSFIFGTNTLETIGTGSYLQLAIRFPVASVFDVQLTDFILTPGVVTLAAFPQTPDAKFKYESVAGWMPVPQYDGSSLGLPLRLTLAGLIFDDAEVGDVIAESQTSTYVNNFHPTSNRLLANGAYYRTGSYSPIGIPLARLQSKYWINSLLMPRYGTGSGYATLFPTQVSGNATYFFTTNTAGSVTAPTDGGTATTFTFTSVHTGATYNATTYYLPLTVATPSGFLIQNNLYGSGFGTNGAGTSTFTFTSVFESAVQKQVLQFVSVAATGLAGLYFQWSNTTTQYYVWFKVGGSGADPAPGGTGIEVDLDAAMTRVDVRNACALSVAGYQVSTVLFVAASAVTAGSYWLFNTLTQNYYVWYTKAGVGTDPAVSGRLGIQVALTGTETAAQVGAATQAAVNMYSFGVPDYRGEFLRGWSNGATVDPDVPPNADTRFSTVPGLVDTTGDVIGSDEFYQNATHVHHAPFDAFFAVDGASSAFIAGGTDFPFTNLQTDFTEATGIGEARPTNIYVNYVIKY